MISVLDFFRAVIAFNRGKQKIGRRREKEGRKSERALTSLGFFPPTAFPPLPSLIVDLEWKSSILIPPCVCYQSDL